MIDIGMAAGEDFSDKIPDLIKTLRPIVGDRPLSIDTLNPKEIKVAAEQLKQIEDNQELMHLLGVNGTPAILQLDETGMMQLHPGAPQGEQLLELFGPRP